ncbi:MAG TPA: 23S rRNA (guanosine(2251)-2'-O)-methyltransferase RlmB [Bacteroidales bacterium]|nr:23S rRNA (guanosine(2251)-2'-O)-methyltransferase RlmB [Bacteroidales bacterium]
MYTKRPFVRKPSEQKSEFIFGIRAVLEAVLAGKDIDKILLRKDLESELSKELFDALKGTRIPVQRVPVEKLNRVTMKNHQGVVAFVSEVTYQRLEDILPTLYEEGKSPFIVLLDGITDVRNFGAIARTCECADVHAIVIPMTDSVSVNADAVKTSAGALHTLPVCREKSIRESILLLKNSGVKVIAASEKASTSYVNVDYTGPVAIVMGAEDTGIANENLRICDELVKIPILGKIGSLNVSVAAGILMYEAVKHRLESGI